MTGWLLHFTHSLLHTVRDVMPIAGIIIGFQLLVIRQPLARPRETLVGFFYVLLGIALFLEGLEMALFPLGEMMAKQLTAPEFIGIAANTAVVPWQAYFWVYIFAASIGFATTLAEPSLIAVAIKAEQISGGAIHAWGLRLAVSFGVAFGIALGAYRIVSGAELFLFIIAGYLWLSCKPHSPPK